VTIKLYSWPQSSGTRIAWALEELGLPYEYVALDAKQGEHRSAGYLKVNPHGKVPALDDDGERLFESCAILLHLGNRYGVDKKLWPAAKGQARADAVCWTVWASTELGPDMLQYLYHGLDTPVSFKPADRSKAAADYSRSQLDRILAALDARLEGREHVLGGFSLADVAVAGWLSFGSAFGVDLAPYPRVAVWLKRCLERPAYKRAR
jgi:glutathione S-transferase